MTPIQLATRKLASSKLTHDDAKKLGILVLDAEHTAKLLPGYAYPSMLLRYHTSDGKPRSDIFRVRFLGDCKNAWGQPLDRRYVQSPGSPVAAYFPKNIAWGKIIGDKTQRIIITEGELKAACACKHGFPAIGLGGVSSWRSQKKGVAFLPELEAVEWMCREVIICFDSDASSNSDVAAATMALCRALVARGAKPRVVIMPVVDGYEKTGLDDFIFAHGSEAFGGLLEKADDDEIARKLWEFNARFAYIHQAQFIWDGEYRTQLTPGMFANAAMSNVFAKRQVGEKLKEVLVADEWMEWPHRRAFSEMTYAPGHSEIHEGKLNNWSGWGCESARGDMRPWVQLLDLLFKGAAPEDRRWFERWCGYPIKVPGTKNLAACGIWSLGQGQGKSLVGVTQGRIYGGGYATISQRQLESDFNSWAANRQFIMVDDVSAHDSRAKADILKKTITQEEVLVNRKFVAEYYLPDCANYYLTSNRADALFLEDNDRRFFIHEVTAEKLGLRFYEGYHRWLNDGGASALRWYFEHELDYGDYSPFREPPKTSSKTEAIELSRSELDTWMMELRSEPGSKLRSGLHHYSRDIYTAAEMLRMFEDQRTNKREPLTATSIGKALRRAGFAQPIGRNKIRIGDETLRLYITRNDSRWLNAPTDSIIKHIEQGRKKDGVWS